MKSCILTATTIRYASLRRPNSTLPVSWLNWNVRCDSLWGRPANEEGQKIKMQSNLFLLTQSVTVGFSFYFCFCFPCLDHVSGTNFRCTENVQWQTGNSEPIFNLKSYNGAANFVYCRKHLIFFSWHSLTVAFPSRSYYRSSSLLIYLPEDEGSNFLWNFTTYLPALKVVTAQ
jgi:hypothetical protein